MKHPPFCTNPNCLLHNPKEVKKRRRKKLPTFHKHGTHYSRAHGASQRYLCILCECTFSQQSFSTDYYAKKKVDYMKLYLLLCSCTSIRSCARILGVSTDTINNRITRMAHQCLAIGAEIRETVTISEAVAMDGFESYAVSKYHPNNHNIAVGSVSKYVYGLSYTQLRRKGRMSEAQREQAKRLHDQWPLEPGHTITPIKLLFQEIGTTFPEKGMIRVYTDEHKSYVPAIKELGAEVLHEQISSREPRVQDNKLAAVNYMDREFRKDMAEHVRSTVCFGRNVNNQLERMVVYLHWHNYDKQYLINDVKERRGDRHAYQAGVEEGVIQKTRVKLFKKRRFISHVWRLLSWSERVLWMRLHRNPEHPSKQYIPKFMVAM